ncbi:MAG: Na+/H+ antiporter NhaC family protein [Acidobacteriota bacterium]|nr:Na+/H+ antiporter NhaC family protein [Acidobacteriota bacterium]
MRSRLRSVAAVGLSFLIIGVLGRAVEAQSPPVLEVSLEGAAITGAPLHLQIGVTGVAEGIETPVEIRVDGQPVETLELGAGSHSVKVEAETTYGHHVVEAHATGAEKAETSVSVLPGWTSVLPPLIAICLALVFKDVLISLFLGILSGAFLLFGWAPWTALARTIDTLIAPTMTDFDRARILIFTTLLGGMVGLITKSAGTQGIVNRVAKIATNARRGQLATWIMGVLVFFDDYANTLIVGPTMRPITDRLRISREKLAYIVDSTAAPIASIIPISTWIGFEVGLIEASFSQLGLEYNAYTTFIASIAYRFYPIFALVLGFTIAYTCRDFGPMLKAERRASDTGKVIAEGDVPLADYDNEIAEPPEGAPRRARNALLPILTVIIITIGGLFASGREGIDRADYTSGLAWLRDVFSNADSYSALLWASLSGVIVALLLAVLQKILTVRVATGAMVNGFKSMLMALVVLILAWSIGEVCGQLHTADYVVGLTRGILSPQLLPALVFFLSAATAFATGTSWGTMGILMPLVIPISHGLALDAGFAMDGRAFYVLLLGTISSVLAGSVWGDHCSPISDTTILSSMASGCDHIAHVRTQMPYALAAGFLGVLVGDLPTAYGMSPWIAILVGSAVIIGFVRWRGKRSDWAG